MNKTIKIVEVPEEVVMSKIYVIRNEKVMLDRDLAELYGVETKVLKQAVTNRFIYSNTIEGEYYRHEITHTILEKFPESGIFHLGIVTYLGTHFGRDLNFHIKRVNDYLKKNKDIDLSNFVDSFYYMDEHTSPHYIIAGIFCHLAIKEGGADKLKKLFSYGSENTYVAIEEEFGVKRKDLDIFLRKKFEYYAKNGLIPITL